MSVYTPLSASEMSSFFTQYQLGDVVHFEGAEGGVENTNFFIASSNKKQYVLTIFESLPESKLPCIVDLIQHLADSNLPVPMPLSDKNNEVLHHLKNKPAMLFPRLAGKHVKSPTLHHCEQIASVIARLHVATQHFPTDGFEDYTLPWALRQIPGLLPLLSPADAQLINTISNQCNQFLQDFNELPSGIIHGDLFYDNALFQAQDEGDQLSGLIDFYHSSPGFLLYDLAVAVNDWCVAENRTLDNNKVTAMLVAYEKVRPLTEDEKQAWPMMLVLAAFRFWVSRLINQLVQGININNANYNDSLGDGTTNKNSNAQAGQNEAIIVTIKNPDEFKQLMLSNQSR